MKYMKAAVITIRLDEDLNAMLAQVAKQMGRSRSDIAREAIRRHVRIAQFDGLRRRMMPFAEARGYLTDEDVFRDIS